MRFTLIVSCLLICCSAAHARTIGIPGNASTIQAGINAASAGDTVLVQPGRYLESIDFKGKNIVVGSLFLATHDSSYILDTIIDAEQKNTVVTFQAGETSAAELCGFTLTNGLSQGTVSNQLNPGGGIYCYNASPYLHHLIVEGNESRLQGGGMYLEKSDSLIEYCVIRKNFCMSLGGGLFLFNGNYKIENCVIDNNFGYGGGICCAYSTVSLFKVLMTKNQQDTMNVTLSEMNIINCTIANNYPDLSISYSKVNIVNSIFWNDTRQILITRDNGHPEQPISHVTIAFSDIKGGKDQIKCVSDSLIYDNTNIDADPLFIDYLHGDYSLNRNSPCIDSGIASYTIGDSTLVDIARKEYNGKTPDIGMFESDYASIMVNENDTYNISLSNNPNPFNATTTIHYSLSKPCHVRLAIYTITGQKVIDLLDKYLPVGNYKTHWNGNEKYGEKVSSGVYIIQLNSGIQSLSKRIVYMK